MVAPIRFLTGRQQQQKIGVIDSTENSKVLEVIGRVGIGTTVFEPTNLLDIRGDANISTNLRVGGISTFQDNVHFYNSTRLKFGDDEHLEIYRVGNESFIHDSGPGGLSLSGANVKIENDTQDEDGLVYTSNAGVEIFYNGIKKFETTGYGVTVSGGLNVSGVTTHQGDIYLGDNNVLRFGTGSSGFGDLQIWHDTQHSYVRDNGTGNLRLKTNNMVELVFGGTNEVMGQFIGNAGVGLYYNGQKKFETTGVGVSIVNGTSDTATIYGPSNLIIDPMPVGVGTTSGIVRIKGDLYVDGTTTQINSTTIEFADFVVGIATTATTDLLTDGAGIGIGSDKTFLYEHNSGTNPSLKSSENLNVASGKHYQIGETEVLSSTTLGSGVTNSSLTSLGTIATGVWQGTAINDDYIDTIDNADKVSLSALNIDGGTDIGALLSDGDLFIVDDGGNGTNRKADVLGITTYTFGKVSGDIVISATGAATIQADSVALGGDTTGDYVQSITGTTNEIEVTSGTGEGSTPTIGLPNDVAITTSLVVGSATTITAGGIVAGIVTGTLDNTLTLGTSGIGLTGSATYNNSGAVTFTVTSDATSANTADTIVSRDSSGNFSAGTITANLTGTATTATNLADGANITTGTISDDRLPDLITSNINIASGISSVATLDATNATIDNLTFTSGTAITTVDTDLSSVSTSDDTLASAKAIKTYVDSQVTAQDLDFAGDTGTGDVDLDSEVLTIAGTASEIETSASGQTLTIGLPNEVAITTSLVVGSAVTITSSGINVPTGVITASSFVGSIVGSLTGIAATATALENPRDFSITGDFVTAPTISFDGTANVALAATITPNSIGLGTYTFGDYVQSITGTTNEIEVTSGTGEGSTPTIGLPNDVTISNDLTVSNNLNVTGVSTFQSNVHFGDNDVLNFGDGNDLQIYSDGTDSYISEQGTGLLSIDSSYIRLRSGDGTTTTATFTHGTGSFGGVQLYWGGNKKFETTGYGVTVSGGAYVSGISTFQNNIEVTGTISVNDTTVVGSETASLSTVTETAIHTGLSASTYRSVEYNIQATQGTNYHVTKILALHNGTTAYHNEYGTIYNNTSVATFNVDVSGGNLRLLATSASASQTDYVVNFTATKV